MQEHKFTPENKRSDNGVQDNNSGRIKPEFELDKFSIGIEDIQDEIQRLSDQGSDTHKKQSNPFPIEAFPDTIQQIITATNESLNYPIDFIGSSMLFAISVAVGNTHKVEVKNGWLESAVMYLAIVGRAGTNKSHPLNFAIQPIVDQDTITYREFETQKAEYEKDIIQTKVEKETQSTNPPKKPVWKKFLLSDSTPEALAEVHKFNKRGIGVYFDELAGWFKNFNRYNKGSEMEFWLSAWSNKSINIDRKSGDPIYIPQPFISVGGTIQTGILSELTKDSRKQNGFLDRILFVTPDNLEKQYWNEKEIEPIHQNNWHQIISNLLTIPIQVDSLGMVKPQVLKFTKEAKDILFDWQKDNTDQCNEVSSEELRSAYSKLDIYVVRLALVLEMAKYACGESNKEAVSLDSVRGALSLIEYFRVSIIKVHSIISSTNPLENYPADKQTLYKELPPTFSTLDGLKIAKGLAIPERTFKRFLNDRELFRKPQRGEYEKTI